MMPECEMAPLITSALPTMMTTSSAKPVNAVSDFDQAESERKKQGTDRNEIASKTPPHESDHHQYDKGYGKPLITTHLLFPGVAVTTRTATVRMQGRRNCIVFMRLARIQRVELFGACA